LPFELGKTLRLS